MNKQNLFKYESQKRFAGYSTCFRQWRADSHCKFLHGYALEFKITFAGELDQRNWVMDFGAFASIGLKKDLDFWVDHTTIIAEDDPHLSDFVELDKKGLIQLRTMVNVGCEMFANHVFIHANSIVKENTSGRVCVTKVKCIETPKNSASYKKGK